MVDPGFDSRFGYGGEGRGEALLSNSYSMRRKERSSVKQRRVTQTKKAKFWKYLY
jgi:hypothetical protein